MASVPILQRSFYFLKKNTYHDIIFVFGIERSGVNEKTQRSAAPCKASGLRRLHGVKIVA